MTENSAFRLAISQPSECANVQLARANLVRALKVLQQWSKNAQVLLEEEA